MFEINITMNSCCFDILKYASKPNPSSTAVSESIAQTEDINPDLQILYNSGSAKCSLFIF